MPSLVLVLKRVWLDSWCVLFCGSLFFSFFLLFFADMESKLFTRHEPLCELLQLALYQRRCSFRIDHVPVDIVSRSF